MNTHHVHKRWGFLMCHAHCGTEPIQCRHTEQNTPAYKLSTDCVSSSAPGTNLKSFPDFCPAVTTFHDALLSLMLRDHSCVDYASQLSCDKKTYFHKPNSCLTLVASSLTMAAQRWLTSVTQGFGVVPWAPKWTMAPYFAV